MLTEPDACNNVGVDGVCGGVTVQAKCLRCRHGRLRVCRLWSDFHARHAAKPLLVCGVRLSADSADDRAGQLSELGCWRLRGAGALPSFLPF